MEQVEWGKRLETLEEGEVVICRMGEEGGRGEVGLWEEVIVLCEKGKRVFSSEGSPNGRNIEELC